MQVLHDVAFLMKDVVLFGLSFYLLKQDAERASWSTRSARRLKRESSDRPPGLVLRVPRKVDL